MTLLTSGAIVLYESSRNVPAEGNDAARDLYSTAGPEQRQAEAWNAAEAAREGGYLQRPDHRIRKDKGGIANDYSTCL